MLGNRWLTAARLSNAQWFAVSLFEDVIELPERIARGSSGGAFGRGSPARYHVPMLPLILGSAIGALATAPVRARQPLLVNAACTGLSAALTGYLVRSVNVPLLTGGADPARRPVLAARWHALNKVRLLLLLGGAAALEKAAVYG